MTDVFFVKRRGELARRKKRGRDRRGRGLREKKQLRDRYIIIIKSHCEIEGKLLLQALQDARIAEETAKVRALQTAWNEVLESWKKQQTAEKEV